MGSSEKLTDDGTLKLAPTFVADGSQIVFSVHDVPRRVTLKRLKLSDRSQERLYPSINAHQLDAAFSSDGRYQCFVMSTNNPQTTLVIRDTHENKEFRFRPIGARSTGLCSFRTLLKKPNGSKCCCSARMYRMRISTLPPEVINR